MRSVSNGKRFPGRADRQDYSRTKDCSKLGFGHLARTLLEISADKLPKDRPARKKFQTFEAKLEKAPEKTES